jgi:hypothetical protein
MQIDPTTHSVAAIQPPPTALHMAGVCGQAHLSRKDGTICNGTCDLAFGHSGSDHCGKCGESF